MSNTVLFIVELVVVVAAFCIAKFVPGVTKAIDTTTASKVVLDFISEWAFKFVILAKNKLKQSTGNEKFDFVKEQLITLCEANHITLTEEQINAAIESAYETMIKEITQITIKEDTEV